MWGQVSVEEYAPFLNVLMRRVCIVLEAARHQSSKLNVDDIVYSEDVNNYPWVVIPGHSARYVHLCILLRI